MRKEVNLICVSRSAGVRGALLLCVRARDQAGKASAETSFTVEHVATPGCLQEGWVWWTWVWLTWVWLT